MDKILFFTYSFRIPKRVTLTRVSFNLHVKIYVIIKLLRAHFGPLSLPRSKSNDEDSMYVVRRTIDPSRSPESVATIFERARHRSSAV